MWAVCLQYGSASARRCGSGCVGVPSPPFTDTDCSYATNRDLLDCGSGLGWKVPDPDNLLTTSVTYLGGIALARMPAYSGDRAADMQRITTLTQELHLYSPRPAPSCSNDHGKQEAARLKTDTERVD